MPRLFRLASLTALATALSCAPAPAPSVPPTRGLLVEPSRLVFVCVEVDCDTSQTLKITLLGDRRAVIKRLLLSSGEDEGFSFKASQSAPFILPTSSEFYVDVTYRPTRAPSANVVELVITYTDASGIESPDRLEAGELRVPLVRRLVGEPILAVRPGSLSFGVVAQGAQKALPIRLSNPGFGNVAVTIASVDAGNPDLAAHLPQGTTLRSDAGVDVAVTWSPSVAEYLSSSIVFIPENGEVEPAVLRVEGTSILVPHLALEPAGAVDFGAVPKGEKRTLARQLVNQGGLDLVVSGIALGAGGAHISLELADGGTTVVLAALARTQLRISLDAQVAGPIMTKATILSNDPSTPALELAVQGTVTEPHLKLTPASVDFGAVPVGWVVSRPIELRNVGYGALTIKGISFVSGSSSLFSFGSTPVVPTVLERDQRVAVEVQFRAETGASFVGSFSVESNDSASPFMEAPLTAASGTCEASCPIMNGTPTCARGKCEVASCVASWFDTDLNAATGCECHDEGVDPGSFCADARSLGNLKDSDHARVTETGRLPSSTDVDVYRFHAEDAASFPGEDFDVRVQLNSNDPSIQMCVYRHDTGGQLLNDCYFENESCPSNGQFRKGGSSFGSDDADFIIKVFRVGGAAAACTPYTVKVSNG